jgi:hypothetical protein
MKAFRAVFGKIFGRKADLPTAPPRVDGDEHVIALNQKQQAQLRSKAQAPVLVASYGGGDGKHTRKSRDQRPPAVRYVKRAA